MPSKRRRHGTSPPNEVTEKGTGGTLSRALLSAGLATLLVALTCRIFSGANLAVLLFRTQDFWPLVFAGLVLLFLSRWRPAMTRAMPASPAAAIVLALAVLAVTYAGTFLVFGGYALTRDEIAAEFDAAFLAQGMLVAPVPPEWQAFAGALMPQFMLPLPPGAGWLSAYLPGNAMLRAIGGDLANPILAAVAILALHRIGRRLWPEEPRLALLPVLLLAGSAQFLAMAMTAYAMPAHLAFNLVWLACFLRGDRKGDAGAIAAGFVATGLHQLLFHPLFVLPFLADLWLKKERKRALVYVACYAAIGLFWTCYWQIVLAGAASAGGGGPGGISYLLERAVTQLSAIGGSAMMLTFLNLARLLSWQNVALLPFVLLAWPLIRRGEGIARPLAFGIALTILVMLVLIPWQGHGWGYRYLHGFLGSFCLLAAYGWKELDQASRRAGALAIATAASLLVILPLHLKQAHDFVAPYRKAYAAIGATPADVVLVDPAGMLYADDLIRNAPDLANRPLIMDLNRLDAAGIRHLCARYRVAIFDRRDGARAGIVRIEGRKPATRRRALLERIGCARPPARA